MAQAVNMPQVGQDIETARILEWYVKEGDQVKKGTILATVESDKASFEVEAYDDGTIIKILYGEGDEAPVFHPIAWIGVPGEEIIEDPPPKNDPSGTYPNIEKYEEKHTVKRAEGRVYSSPAARRMARENNISIDEVSGSGPGGSIIRKDVESYLKSHSFNQLKVTPLAREISKKEGITTGELSGTGTHGRITRSDVLAGIDARRKMKPQVLLPEPSGPDEVVYYDSMRKHIADRMTLSKQTIPHYYLFRDLDITEAQSWRKNSQHQRGYRISINDLLVQAMARALLHYPRLNAYVDDEKTIIKKDINIGLAVDTHEGLLVPCIANADKLTLEEISLRSQKIAGDARCGILDPAVEASITITNLGKLGVQRFMAIINPPECAILSVGSAEKRVVAREEGTAVREIMSICLACDHRAVDGAYAAAFLNKFEEEFNMMLK